MICVGIDKIPSLLTLFGQCSLYSLETLENVYFLGVLSGYKIGTLASNGLTTKTFI